MQLLGEDGRKAGSSTWLGMTILFKNCLKKSAANPETKRFRKLLALGSYGGEDFDGW